MLFTASFRLNLLPASGLCSSYFAARGDFRGTFKRVDGERNEQLPVLALPIPAARR